MLRIRSLLGLMILAASLAGAAMSEPVITLWPKGAPGSEARKAEPEQAKDWWVKNIHNPSLTVFAPEAAKNTGTAVIIVPGGGHSVVVFPPEGIEPAQYLQARGVTAFALKYRLFREEGSTYKIEDAEADLKRAIRYVRLHAAEYGINPDRIGVMGWSAGGELVSLVSYEGYEGNAKAADPLERLSARPDFQIVVYPGPLGIPDSAKTAPPPAFLINAYDDRMAMGSTDRIVKLYSSYPEIPLERHVLSGGGHGFNMGGRSKLKAVHDWPQRLTDWMSDMGYLTPKP